MSYCVGFDVLVVLGLCWVCVGFVLGLCWVCFGFVLGLCWVCVGFVLHFSQIEDSILVF